MDVNREHDSDENSRPEDRSTNASNGVEDDHKSEPTSPHDFLPLC